MQSDVTHSRGEGRTRTRLGLMLAAWITLAGIVSATRPQDPESRPESTATTQPKAAESRPAADEGSLTIQEACERYEIGGFVSLSYRARKEVGYGNDEDLYGYVSLDGGNPDLNDCLFHLLGRVTWDFEGGASDDDPFFSLNDVGGHPVDFHLYEAFVDLQRGLAPGGLGIRRARLGRQNIYGAFTYLVDGARFDFEPIESLGCLEIGVYGGIPEYLYEESRAGDWIAGLDASFQPWRDARIDLRYTHVEDENEWVGSEVDDYVSIGLRQRLGDDLSFYALWNTIDAGTRDASIRVDWFDPCLDWSVHGTYLYQATITKEYTTEYDPYVGSLGPSYAYHQVQIDASKSIGNHFAVDAGLVGRILVDDADESAFNHEFVRTWLTLSSAKWPVEDIDLALTGELWYADDADTASVGGEITWRPSDRWRVGTGSYYSLYKQDYFLVDEREDVTTIFLKLRWRLDDHFRFDGRYEYETGDEGDYHTFLLGMTWTF